MAKKRTAKAKADKAPKGEKVTAADVMKMPSESVVRSVAKDIRATKDRVGKFNEELSTVVGEAKKEKGIHPGALKRVEALVNKAKTTDRGRAAVATELAHFDYYRDVLSLDKMKASDMFLDQNPPKAPSKRKKKGDGVTGADLAGEEGAQGEAATEQQISDNVTALDTHRDVA